jgi:hypothetical protein
MPAVDVLATTTDTSDPATGPGRPLRNSRALVPALAAAAVVALVLAASAVHWLGPSPADGSQPADAPAIGPAAAIPTASAKDQWAVTGFIQHLRRKRLDFSPVADWTGDRLVLAVPDPTSAPWPGVAGEVVGGLRLTVLKAAVSMRDYDHAISTIGRATFPDSDTIQSYDYPIDGSHIIVRVHGLAAMDGARRAALTANLERISGVPVELIKAMRMISLVGRTH